MTIMHKVVGRILVAALAALLSARTVAAAESAAESSPSAAPKPTKTVAAPKVAVNVTDCVVFLADAVNPEMNARALFPDSFPRFVEDLRKSPGIESNDATPGPFGIIRLMPTGELGKDASIDVQLGVKQGRVLGQWPRATVRSAGILWQDLSLAAHSASQRPLPDGHWLAPLRAEGTALKAGGNREPFLLYDFELACATPVQVKAAGGGKYSIAHGMEAPILDATFYKPEGEHEWRSATLAKVEKSAGFVKPEAAPAAQPAAMTTVYSSAPVAVVTVAGVGVRAKAIAGATAKSEPAVTGVVPTAAANIKVTEFSLGAASLKEEAALSPWRAKLTDAGVLPSDQDAVLKVLARFALDSKRLTLVFRIDPAEQERLMPLEVVPQPSKISRIALVIVRGIDPAVGAELDELIKKLGDPSWKVREQATKEILKLGVMAKSRLEEAEKSKDVEVAFRAEQLLARLSQPGDPTQDDTGN
jgi:hypothetical protein